MKEVTRKILRFVVFQLAANSEATFVSAGKGHFGTVYHGEYTENVADADGNAVIRKVAVKTLSRIEDMDSVEAFLHEGLLN